ncbi:MAG: transglycosylase domain-containing protein [Flavobacteriales bacterium]|nr:transglycosylase domain-containing protein [Flavobacteriales bacterium]
MTKNKANRKLIRWLWLLVFSPIILLSIAFGMAAIGIFGALPTFEELENPRSNQATVVYSIEGKELGKYYIENRTNVSYEEISPNVFNALVATEDERFYNHSGIDAEAMARVFKGIITRSHKGGGSTITQQLAKLLFHDKPKSKIERVFQKFKEWVIALELERSYTKKEIITMYLNIADFGHNIFGISSAAKIYFDKHPSELSINEASMLVGLLKAPTRYSPIKNPDRCKTRRNVVLMQQVKNKFLTHEQYEALKDEPVIVDYQLLDKRIEKNTYGHGDLAPYFMEELKKDLMIWCERNINPQTGKPYNLFKDGLHIYTSIDYKMQTYAEQSIKEYMPELQDKFFRSKKGKKNAPFSYDLKEDEIEKIIQQAIKRSDGYKRMKDDGMTEDEIQNVFNTPVPMKVFSWRGDRDTVMSPRDSIIYHKFFLHNGMMAMNPHTGQVKAWVGGIDFRYFKYDHVRAGRYDKKKDLVLPAGGRQVGSTFKPFVYAMAMQEGRSPCEQVPNVRVCIEKGIDKPWCPDNSSDYKEGGMVTLREALANSINYISALLMKQYGPHAIVNLVQKMGVTSSIEPVPSICLGTSDISVIEMVGAFSTFFNKGIYTKPIFLLRIEDKNGSVLQEFVTEQREVMNEQSAFLMVELMKGVVLQGTAGRLRSRYKFTYPVAGKTGTTQNNSDGWFIGATPNVVCGVWTGAEDRSVHFYSTADGQGANMALPIWAIFMKKVYDDTDIDINRGDFDKPSTPISTELDCKEYQLNEWREGEDSRINFDNIP